MKNQLDKGVPTLEEAKIMLAEASKLNPGPWVEHSLNVDREAELITEYVSELDKNTALVLGMLHDIGRRAGVTDMRHSLDGYYFASEKCS